jgi:hypothetical protein
MTEGSSNNGTAGNYTAVIFMSLLFSLCFMSVTLLISCGRRGDPVVVAPGNAIIAGDVEEKTGAVMPEQHNGSYEEADSAEPVLSTPGQPTGLTALYTGESIILVWNDLADQDITSYKIYRSSGEGYILIGEVVTPAFTDRDCDKNRTCRYKVTAVRGEEGPASEEISVVTKEQ